MVEHPVDNDTGNGDEKPDRQCPAGNPDMLPELFSERTPQCHQRQWHNDNGQCEMREEDRIVESFRPAGHGKARNAMRVVIGKIADQENRRGRECGKHASLVRLDSATPDEPVTGTK